MRLPIEQKIFLFIFILALSLNPPFLFSGTDEDAAKKLEGPWHTQNKKEWYFPKGAAMQFQASGSEALLISVTPTAEEFSLGYRPGLVCGMFQVSGLTLTGSIVRFTAETLDPEGIRKCQGDKYFPAANGYISPNFNRITFRFQITHIDPDDCTVISREWSEPYDLTRIGNEPNPTLHALVRDPHPHPCPCLPDPDPDRNTDQSAHADLHTLPADANLHSRGDFVSGPFHLDLHPQAGQNP